MSQLKLTAVFQNLEASPSMNLMCSTGEDLQYQSGTSLVQARMWSMSKAHLEHKGGCAV